MRLLTLLVNVIVVQFGCCQTWQERKPTVMLQQGLLEGRSGYTESRKMFDSFLGIPYAAPPVENYRFAPPQKHLGWNGTHRAIKRGPRCAQFPMKSNDSEDCLYLNIWAPMNSRNYGPLPVVIFFEASNFLRSSELPISGEDLAIEGVVIVTVNYRLNIFGFFCLGTNEARGNMGLLDQYFAILWVKDHIRYFGGDPEKLTLFGQSSGAVSVALHLASPRTAGLFQRAIISGGSAVSPWQTYNNPIEASKQILKMLGCNLYTTDYLRCLRSKKTRDILQILQEYFDSYKWTDEFLPVVDTFLPETNRYLPYDPSKAFKEATVFQVPILTGISKPIAFPELSEWSDLASQGYQQLQQYIEKAKIPEILRVYKFTNSSYRDQIFDLIKWKYTSPSQGDVRILVDQIKNLEFQAKTEAPHFLQLSYLSSYVQPVYVYYMDDMGFSLNTTDSLATSESLLLFGPSLLKLTGRRRFLENEARLSSQIKRMWIDFINVGNPTPNNNRVKQWRKYTSDDRYIEDFRFHVSSRSSEEIKDRTERISFWNYLLPKISKYRNSVSNAIPKELQNSPDPAAGFRHAMYTLVGLVTALLCLLVICIILLKRRASERDREFHVGY